MNRWLVGAAALVMTGVFAGCCGSGGSSDDTPSGDMSGASNGIDRFAGSWLGQWSDPVMKQSGANMLTIGTDGTMTGTVKNDTMSLVGALTGQIDATGAMSYTYSYPGQIYTAKGTCSIAATGNMLCNTTQYDATGTPFGSAIVEHVKQ